VHASAVAANEAETGRDPVEPGDGQDRQDTM